MLRKIRGSRNGFSRADEQLLLRVWDKYRTWFCSNSVAEPHVVPKVHKLPNLGFARAHAFAQGTNFG
jgi:hypothetical protein